jgi:hybrid cluster-associated redox disulfide protein
MPTIEISPKTNIRELVAAVPIAEEVLTQFGLHCTGCGVNKYETIEQGANAHGLQVDPIVAALDRAKRSGRVPAIRSDEKQSLRRAPGEFKRRAAFKHVVPIMSGKGGVGKSLITGLIAAGLRRRHALAARTEPQQTVNLI